MTTLLLSGGIISDMYNEVSEKVNNTDVSEKKVVRKKTLKDMMKESFFHGSSRFGDNFIA